MKNLHRWLRRTVWLIAFLLASASGLAAVFTTDTTIGTNDPSYDGADIIITNCTVTVDGPHAFASLQVLTGGRLTHSGSVSGALQDSFTITNEEHVLTGLNPVALNYSNVVTSTILVTDSSGLIVYTNNSDYLVGLDGGGFTTIQRTDTSSIPDGSTVKVTYTVLTAPVPTGLNLAVAGDVVVEAGGAINVNGLGYGANFGPGAGGSAGSPASGGGGGHGGYGSLSSSNAPGGDVYDSVLQPADKGSGGGGGYAGAGGNGGGAVKLILGGTLRVDGAITANGASGFNERSGGGAGGGLWLQAQTITGSGSISADGGAGEPVHGGGGGGGRIALYFQSNGFTGAITARGGRGPSYGGAGTIYTRPLSQHEGGMVADNGGHTGTNTLLAAEEPFHVSVSGGAVLSINATQTIASLLVASNGWVSWGGPAAALLAVTGDAAVQVGGGLTADGTGNPGNLGPGAGRTLYSAGIYTGGGGGYGGYGALSRFGAYGGVSYGNLTRPIDRGSGGGNVSGVSIFAGGPGGGAIQLNVAGTLSLNGELSADGKPGIGQGSGGGSGGSIWLTVGTLSGAGAISANGGAGNGLGGGGGGGRIALYYDASDFTGAVAALGAGSGATFGGAGTIYAKASGQSVGSLLVDNAGRLGTNTPVSAPEPFALTVSSGAQVVPSTALTLGGLVVGSNAAMLLTNLSLTVTGNAVIQDGGVVSVDAAGYAAGLGPGAGRSVPYSPPGGGGFYTGGGGGFGGYGASSAVGANGGITYGVITQPSLAGSGGGSGSGLSPTNVGGAGGGVLRLSVSNTLYLDGRLSAEGSPGLGPNSGGGSGGSVWLTVGTLSGGGLISANGGVGNGLGGGGGAGRIAIYPQTNRFTGMVRAWGGGGTNTGGAGTVYTRLTGQQYAQVRCDNNGSAGTNTDLASVPASIDLTIVGGAMVSNNVSLQLGTLFVGSNSWLLTAAPFLTVASNATIQTRGGISADGGGNPAGSGQGGGRSSGLVGGGGGFGGYGGAGSAGTAFGGNVYGNALSYAGVGSGGGSAGTTNYGGSGGGAIRLSVQGALQLDGEVSADGRSGLGINSGGGSGGSVWITAGSIAGAGLISANGGAGPALGGGGGGGRIIVTPTLGTNAFTGQITAYGGNGFGRGGAGTIYTKNSPQSFGLVVADNGGTAGTNTSLPDTVPLDVTIRNGGKLVPGPFSFSPRNLLIASNGWLVLSGHSFTVSGTANVQAGGGITADGTGYPGGSGPGAGAQVGPYPRGGGGYGGFGGANIDTLGRSYGALQTPTDPGSGGGNGSGSTFAPFGGAGGGAMHITLLNNPLVLDGRISADGGTGQSNSGGGSGGSIWLTLGTLTGSGRISANGGAGYPNAGGGGGGRIAITYTSNLLAGPITAYGGGGLVGGGAGTIFLRQNSQNVGQVTIDNGGRSGTNSGLGGFSGPAVDVTVTDGAMLLVPTSGSIRNLLITSNSWMTSGSFAGSLLITGDATVQAGGGVSGDGRGSPPGSGTGPGATASSAYGFTGGGGGHGGFGAPSLPGSAGGLAYGSITAPTTFGSGGGAGAGLPPNNLGGAGGAAIVLNVAGNLRVDGRVSANGTNGVGQGSGGGAGGSVSISAGILSGSGTISANGGPGNGLGGGGAGGHVALAYNSNLFSGFVSAFGGPGGSGAGGAGTIHSKGNSDSVARVLVDGGGSSVTNTPLSVTGPYDLAVRNGAIAYNPSGFFVLSNLTVGAGGTLAGLKPQAKLEVAVLGNAFVESGGALAADGAGYAQGAGPGAGPLTNGIGSGGGYGGAGGASSLLPGGPTYGSAQQPVDRGSGGGAAAFPVGGSEGGGAIRLTVGGALVVDGRLSVNGNPARMDDAGGGSGGSLWLTAGTLGGSGVLTADGGYGEWYQGGGGGGGRVAVYTRTNLFAGQISAAGAEGYGWGADGSIYSSTNFESLVVWSNTPVGLLSNAVGSLELFFNSPANPYSVSVSDFVFMTPYGPMPAGDLTVSQSGPTKLLLSFPSQTAVGDYTILAGPQIEDLFGQPMSQVYTGSFSILLPVIQGTVTNSDGLPVAGVVLQPSTGSIAVTDTNGSYTLGFAPGSAFTVAPSLPGLMFVPGTRYYSGLSGSISNENYLAVTTIAPSLTTQVQSNNLLLGWQGIPGVTYQTYSSSNLLDWLPYDVAFPGSNGLMQLVLPIDPAAAAKFFRLRATN